MLLTFFGRGSGFADEHTSAYFVTKSNDLVVFDCPVTAFFKLKHMDLSSYNDVYFLITHTHGDHISGLGLYIQFSKFNLMKKAIVIAPSYAVSCDIQTLLQVEGIDPSWYSMKIVENEIIPGISVVAIPTVHVLRLKNKCFGYQVKFDGHTIVYSGDTSLLSPYTPFISENSEIYMDTSINDSTVHLKLDNVLKDYLRLNQKGVKVYLMHLDNAKAIEFLVKKYPDINVVNV